MLDEKNMESTSRLEGLLSCDEKNDVVPSSSTNQAKMRKKKSIEEGGVLSGKKERCIWTDELHTKFLDAVNILGIKYAVPMKILKIMNTPGLTRENVSSHLQKFRRQTLMERTGRNNKNEDHLQGNDHPAQPAVVQMVPHNPRAVVPGVWRPVPRSAAPNPDVPRSISHAMNVPGGAGDSVASQCVQSYPTQGVAVCQQQQQQQGGSSSLLINHQEEFFLMNHRRDDQYLQNWQHNTGRPVAVPMVGPDPPVPNLHDWSPQPSENMGQPGASSSSSWANDDQNGFNNTIQGNHDTLGCTGGIISNYQNGSSDIHQSTSFAGNIDQQQQQKGANYLFLEDDPLIDELLLGYLDNQNDVAVSSWMPPNNNNNLDDMCGLGTPYPNDRLGYQSSPLEIKQELEFGGQDLRSPAKYKWNLNEQQKY